ncbi:transcriptional repressor LexA [Mitsuokella multacida]|uniref:transcriptional repressor LexA n=1 Tax=Mitsuokella multacida TaxID=52226 RepID=UPI0039F4B0F3
MRKTRKSSDRQKEIFQFIKAFLLEKGYPPSVREIGEAVGLKSSSTVHGYLSRLSRLEANGMIKRDPTKPRAIDILDERPWRQNVPVPMLMGIHKGAALFSERNIRDVYSFPQDMLGTHKKTYLLHMPDDGLQEAGIAEGDVLFITPQEFANDFDLVVAETEGRTLVRYFRQDEDGTYLQSTAETDDSTEPCKNAVTIVARVISVYHRI